MNFILFILCSSVGTAVDIGILNILAKKIKERDANIISYSVGVIVSFFTCRAFVFTEAQDKLGERLLLTIITHTVGLLIQQWLFKALLKRGIAMNLAKTITIVENAIVMLILTKFIVFKTF